MKLILTGVCWLYTIVLWGFFVWRWWRVEWSPWITLINSFLPWTFVPMSLLLLCAILIRSRSSAIAALSVCLLFTWTYGARFLPSSHLVPASHPAALNVMTFNLGPGVAQPERVVAAIEAENADIIAVQELITDTAQLIQQRLREHYPTMILDVPSGRGLLSRYPLRQHSWVQMSPTQRATLHAILDTPYGTMHVFAVHPLPPELIWFRRWELSLPVGVNDVEQTRQFTDLVQRAQTITDTVLILGDFNISEQSHAYWRLSESYADAYHDTHWGFGFTFPYGLTFHQRGFDRLGIDALPLPGPFLRLDYIFHSREWATQSARIVCGTSSDHCYLIAQLAPQQKR